jgi:hypothetical protein
VHQRRTECFGACPGLGTAAVDVYPVYVGCNEGSGAGELEMRITTELGNGWWRVGGSCEIWVDC